ncbi:hypothetical protein ACC705_34675, partial [Rhizobium ruizarguesonis]
MFRGQFVSVTRIAFVIVTVVFVVLAVRELSASIRTASISIVAERIERGETVAYEVVTKYAVRSVDVVYGHYCQQPQCLIGNNVR